MSNSDKVWPTGLTEAESEEIHRNLIPVSYTHLTLPTNREV